MWLVIDKNTKRVFATETTKPPDGAYSAERYEIKEWFGPQPRLAGMGEDGAIIQADLDPTPADGIDLVTALSTTEAFLLEEINALRKHVGLKEIKSKKAKP